MFLFYVNIGVGVYVIIIILRFSGQIIYLSIWVWFIYYLENVSQLCQFINMCIFFIVVFFVSIEQYYFLGWLNICNSCFGVKKEGEVRISFLLGFDLVKGSVKVKKLFGVLNGICYMISSDKGVI